MTGRFRLSIGVVLVAGTLIFGAPVFAQPTTAADADADGVLDADDACPDTPRNATVAIAGCASFEVAFGLTDLLAESHRNLSVATETIRRIPDIASFADAVDRALRLHQLALSALRAGAPCRAERVNSRFLEKLSDIEQRLEGKVARVSAKAPPTYFDEPDEGDATESDSHIVDLLTAHSLLKRAQARLSTDLRGLAAVCAAVVGPLRVHGRIASIDDRRHRITLDSGLVLHRALRKQRRFISEGMNVDIVGLDMGQSTGVATVILAGEIRASTLELGCLFPRIAPVQPFPPYAAGPITTHDPLAYRVGGTDTHPDLMLEQGQRIAILAGGCGDGLPGVDKNFSRYSAQVDLWYSPGGTSPIKYLTLALDLEPGDEPVPLPDDINAGFNDHVTIILRKQTCSKVLADDSLTCTNINAIRVDTYRLIVRPFANLCAATYAVKEFDLENLAPGEARGTGVMNAVPTLNYNGSPLGGDPTDLSFEAEGYGFDGGTSTFPTVEPIHIGKVFAVPNLEQDFYVAGDLHARENSGVEHPAGLRFPRLHGKRDGRSFWYACRPSRITRDVLAYCGGGAPNTYFKFPFEGGAPTWWMGQANNGGSHHDDSLYAFDIHAPAGSVILAARHGRVIDVLDENSGNCYDLATSSCSNCDYPNATNYIAIEHEDGTIGRYLHSPENGSTVSIGDEVQRGDAIGIVGKSGCAGSNHLHFSNLESVGEPSVPIRFESAVPGHETCYLPVKGDPIESTNTWN